MKEISDLLNTGLDDESLKICLKLLEAGVNPEALATVVTELRKESSALTVSSTTISLVLVAMLFSSASDLHFRVIITSCERCHLQA